MCRGERSLQVITFFCCLIYIYGAIDPCKNSTVLPYITQRLVGYSTARQEPLICDYYLQSGWYSLGHYVLADSNATCWTSYAWYMKESLPKNGEKVVTVCRQQGLAATACLTNTTAVVKICDDGNYVFNLNPLEGCSEAYCIKNRNKESKDQDLAPPDMTTFAKPKINVDAVRHGAEFQLKFYCDIEPIENENLYFYAVEWSLTTGSSITNLITSSESQYTNETHFRSKTFMSETHLNVFGIQTLGFSIKGTGNVLLAGAESRKDVELRLTVPFGCSAANCELTFGIFTTNLESCKLSQVTIGKRDRKPCGIRFLSDEINKYKPFTVVAHYGENMGVEYVNHMVQLKSPKYPDHKIFGDYQIDPIRVEILNKNNILNGKRCYAHSDPHMKTFDGVTYDYQYKGTFSLYKNSNKNTEVQIKTKKCANYAYNWQVYCTCGLLIRAGRDIYSIDMCDKSSILDQGFRMCEDKLLKGKIQRETGESKYIVTLPTGTIVEARVRNPFIEVDIIPSSVDINRTEGLCGTFDLNRANDVPSGTRRAQSVPVDLFDRSNYASLESYDEIIYLCTCRQHNDLAAKPESVCDTSQHRSCKYGSRKTVDDHNKCSINRRKRSVAFETRREDDRHFSVDTSFSSLQKGPVDRKIDNKRKVRSAHVYTNTTAKNDCIRLMNTTVVQMCSDIPNLDLDSYFENCVADALVTNSMNWTRIHLEGFKSKCIHDVQVNQPLTKEALEELQQLKDVVKNATSHLYNDSKINETWTETIPLQPNPSFENVYSNFNFTPALLEDIRFSSCPDECNGHGKCVQGKCLCEINYIGFDCSVDADQPPEMIGIPDKGLCDTRRRLCAKTSIFAQNLVELSSLSCRLTPFKIGINGSIATESSLKTEASMESFMEVICQLPNKRSRRSPAVLNSHIAGGYNISVSNDGVRYSEEDAIIIFDSECVNCAKNGGKIACVVKSGYCVNDGTCYKKSESVGCDTCTDNLNGVLQWIHTKGCDAVTTNAEKTNASKLWIIGAVCGPLICLIIMLMLFMCYRSRKSVNRQKTYSRPEYDMSSKPRFQTSQQLQSASNGQ